MVVVFVFKNGHEFKVRCENFSVTINSFTGRIEGYKMKDIDGNKPLYIDLNEVLYVYKERRIL